MINIGNRIRSIFENASRGREKRKAERSLRITRIREKKKEIARDIAAGHNVGDFSLDPTDVTAIMKTIETGKGICIADLKKLYERYRGF